MNEARTATITRRTEIATEEELLIAPPVELPGVPVVLPDVPVVPDELGALVMSKAL